MREIQQAPPSQSGMESPTCPKCGRKMWLTLVVPDSPDHDRAFECPECDRVESKAPSPA
jgi:DNA-directed RNA polymerase subunit RPC12/RpoP